MEQVSLVNLNEFTQKGLLRVKWYFRDVLFLLLANYMLQDYKTSEKCLSNAN